MKKIKIKNLLSFLLIGFVFIACSKSDAQKDFENEAFRAPQNITETTPNGSLVEDGSVDPEDWRIAPDYQTLIRVDPAYPNPVNINSLLQVEVNFLFSNQISELIVFTFQDPTQDLRFIDSFDQSLSVGFDVLEIPASQIALPSGVGTSSEYRILITDKNENIITYGDIRVIQ